MDDGWLESRVELGELLLGRCEADLKPVDLAEPALALGFGDPVNQVVADLDQPVALEASGRRSEHVTPR